MSFRRQFWKCRVSWSNAESLDRWTAQRLVAFLAETERKRKKEDIGLLTSDFGFRTSGLGLKTLDFGLRTLDFGLWTPDVRFRMTDFGHRTSCVDDPSRRSEGLKPFRDQICANCELASAHATHGNANEGNLEFC